VENRLALSAVAITRLISLQEKVLRNGEIDLPFHTFCNMELASWVILLDPCEGSWCGERLAK
jgi:hypothetical protein